MLYIHTSRTKNIRSADILLLLLPSFVLYSWKRNFSKHTCKEDRRDANLSRKFRDSKSVTYNLCFTTIYYIINIRYRKRSLKWGLYNVSMDVNHNLTYIICITILLKSYYRCEFDGEVLSCYEKTLKMHVNMHPPQRVVAFCIRYWVVDF